MPTQYYNVFHMTNSTTDQGFGKRIPSVYVTPNWIEICYPFSGNSNGCYGRFNNFQLNTTYHFEATQEYNLNGQAMYKAAVNGSTIFEGVNTTPMKFQDVKLYLSNPWNNCFADYGSLANLKIISVDKNAF